MSVVVNTPLADEVIAAIRAVVGGNAVGLHEPLFAGNEWAYLKECLDSTYVSSVGKFVERFEAELAVYTGARYAVAVCNGTAALHVALLLAGVQPDDEVLVPALTFAATANAVAYCRATPHFIDSEFATLGVSVSKLRAHLEATTRRVDGHLVNASTGRIIRALVPMHTFGHPSDVDGLLELCSEFALVLVEDAAESLGSYYHGRHTGTFGLLATLSFNGNKTITTGGGGAILTNDEGLAKKAKHMTTTAKLPHPWEYRHDQVGFNYRMPNLNAALGCAQLEQLPALLRSKRNLHDRYREAFSAVAGVKLIEQPVGCQSNYWLDAILLDQGSSNQRDAILAATNGLGIMTRPIWTLMPEMEHFSKCPRMDLTGASALASRLINIPSSPKLGLHPA